MSWWDIDDDNVTGDAPADSIRSALSAVAEERRRQGRPLPTLREVLGGFARALKTLEENSTGDDAPPAFQAISAHLDSTPEPISVPADAEADAGLLDAFTRAFVEIDEQYRERWERPARRPELLEALSFILGYRPDRFLSDAAGLNILDLKTT